MSRGGWRVKRDVVYTIYNNKPQCVLWRKPIPQSLRDHRRPYEQTIALLPIIMSYFIQSLTGRYGYPRMLPNLVWKELRLFDFTNEDESGFVYFFIKWSAAYVSSRID